MIGMIETARNSVQNWEIDQMGHMNIQFYAQRAMDGLAALAIRIGLGANAGTNHGQVLTATELHVNFLRERRVGAQFFLRGGVLDADAARMTVYQEMVASVSGEIAATFTMDLELRDSATDAVCALPQEVRESALQLRIERPEYARSRGLAMDPPRPALTLREAESMGLIATYQAELRAHQCNNAGRLDPGGFMALASSAFSGVLAHAGDEATGHDDDIGGAALEYRFVYRRHPRAGDVVAVRSALIDVGEKIYVFCHWMFDLETGEALASAEGVLIALDTKARKATRIPDGLRAHLQSLVVDGIGV